MLEGMVGGYAVGQMSPEIPPAPHPDAVWDEFEKAWKRPLILKPRATAAEKARIQSMRDNLRRELQSRGAGPSTNYGVPHKVRLDTPVPRKITQPPIDAAKRVITQEIAPKAAEAGQKLGTAVGQGAEQALQAGGQEFGRAASKGLGTAGARIGLGIAGASVLGGGATGVVVRYRRKKSGKENVVLNRKTGKLQVA